MIVRIFLALAAIFVLLLVGAYFLPSTFQLSRSETIQANHGIIYNYVSNLKKWNDWTAWNTQKDPTMKVTFGDVFEGKGAVQSWKGDNMGNGTLTITESFPLEGIKYRMMMSDKFEMNGHIRFTPDMEKNSTQVEWITSGSMGNNPIFRYFSPFLDKWIGNDLEEGLQKLKVLAEKEAATALPSDTLNINKPKN